MEFFASCPQGFERLLAAELSGLGATKVRPLKGQVVFGEGQAQALRACLWSRLASRVMLVLGRIDATDANTLYEGLAHIPWEDHLVPGATLSIDAHGTNRELRDSRFVALRSKDAISDRLLARRGARPVTSASHADATVVVRISHERATVALDLSAEPLFYRGNRPGASLRGTVAPLRSDYAAALLALGGWYRDARHLLEGEPQALVATLYGTGSVLVEAAGQALDVAPGLSRARWGHAAWAGLDSALWDSLVQEGRQRAEKGHLRAPALTLIACDPRPGAQKTAARALAEAGLAVKPRYVLPEALTPTLEKLAVDEAATLATCDLSWLQANDLPREASCLGTVRALRGLCTAALARDSAIDAALGHAPNRTIEVMVGRDSARMALYQAGGKTAEADADTASVLVHGPQGGAGQSLPVLVAASSQFARRLSKMARQRARWAARELVSCYRVYDRDLPDYAVTIDLFQGLNAGERWLCVSEYAAPRSVDATLARERLLDVLALAPPILGVVPENTFLRVRSHGRGGSQYAEAPASAAKKDKDGRPPQRNAQPQHYGAQVPQHERPLALPPGAHLVDEGGLSFEVNFSGRLDCGLFLDQRETRSLVRELMKQAPEPRRFLNLFCYTGSATCYAADGGAAATTSVDLSRPSLDWARRNMERNGFAGRQHEYVQADVIQWVDEQRHSSRRWELVFCDVPTFSNSSRMHTRSWDVQRDHAELLIGVSRLLAKGGQAIFSCNLKGFSPDLDTLGRAGVVLEDITEKTIPEDFSRSPKVHHCYLVRRVRPQTTREQKPQENPRASRRRS